MYSGYPVNKLCEGRGLLAALCLLLFLAAVFLTGCGTGKTAEKPWTGADYYKVLDRWSRGLKLYEGLESRLYLNATYKGEEFRKAYIRRYAESYALGPERTQALLERELEQGLQYNEFFFTAYTPDERLNDFGKKDSVWQLYLEDGEGGLIRPISVSRIENSEAVIREFFPYYDLWSRAYAVKFPVYSETGQAIAGIDAQALKLVVTGIMGRGELVWRLAR